MSRQKRRQRSSNASSLAGSFVQTSLSRVLGRKLASLTRRTGGPSYRLVIERIFVKPASTQSASPCWNPQDPRAPWTFPTIARLRKILTETEPRQELSPGKYWSFEIESSASSDWIQAGVSRRRLFQPSPGDIGYLIPGDYSVRRGRRGIEIFQMPRVLRRLYCLSW